VCLSPCPPCLRGESFPSSWVELPPGQSLDLGHSFRCGQIFRWREVEGTWVGSLDQTALALTPAPGGIRVAGAGAPLAGEAIGAFLGLRDDLTRIGRRIATDAVIARAVAALPGMRILRQDPWECLITYISSAWNNIPKIDRSMGLVACRWGTRHPVPTPAGQVEVACFPPPAVLAQATEAELRECGLGYRAPLVLATAGRVAETGLDLAALRALPYADALRALLELPGVGRKVADCILLFSLEKSAAFPVDVWVRRLVHLYYARPARRFVPLTPEALAAGLADREYNGIQAFAWHRWGRWAGYAQQYLFYARRLGIV
jgi:N-glycosylase/DNA lyase